MNHPDLPPDDPSHAHFLALIQEVRPELHRYCARMTGSVIDGEDVVQETLARAHHELSRLRELPALRSWLFRIAHRRSIDHLRRRDRDRELPWHLAPMWLDGREVIAVGRDPTDRPRYLIGLELAGERVLAIRDFRYVPHLLDDLGR